MSIAICENCGVRLDIDFEAYIDGYCTECAWELGVLKEEETE